jgi:hypothetical protein
MPWFDDAECADIPKGEVLRRYRRTVFGQGARSVRHVSGVGTVPDGSVERP